MSQVSNIRLAQFQAFLAQFNLRDASDAGVPFLPRREYVGKGWHGILKELFEDLGRLGWDRQLVEVRENLGELRMHIRDRRPELLARIEVARQQSRTVCEQCGKGAVLTVTAKRESCLARTLRRQSGRWAMAECRKCRP